MNSIRFPLFPLQETVVSPSPGFAVSIFARAGHFVTYVDSFSDGSFVVRFEVVPDVKVTSKEASE